MLKPIAKQKDFFLEKYMNRFVPKYRAFMILKNKVEVVVQKKKLLWKSTFGLTTEVTNNNGKGKGGIQESEKNKVTIEDIHIDEEDISVLKSQKQGNVSPTHSTTPDTCNIKN